MHFLILGTLFNDDAVINDDGEVITPATVVEGYHLNTSAKLKGLDAHLSRPKTPKTLLNTPKQYFYSFQDEKQFVALCMLPVMETRQVSTTVEATDPETGEPTGELLEQVVNQQFETGELEFNTDLFIPNVEVPEKVTARQAHGILIIRGMHRAIVAHFESLDEPERSLALNDFERSRHFYRHNSSLEKSALEMGMTSEQIDDLFIEAGKLFLEEETA